MEVASIYMQFRRALLSFIRSKVKSNEDAEDILQNVFIKISLHVNQLVEDEKLKGWVYAITRNAIIDYYRSKNLKNSISINASLEESLPEKETPDTTKGLDQCITGMIDLLPEAYRNIIIDSEINGIRQKELAEKYDMAYPSMRSRVQRGREKLKQLFHDCCHIKTDRLGNVLDAQSRSSCGGPCNPCAE